VKKLKIFQNRYIFFLFIFLITLLIFYRVIPRLVNGSITIYVNISELNGESGNFSVSYRLILEIIFMGPVFAIVYYFLMKYLIQGINQEVGKNRYYIYLLEIGVITSICISCMGHAIHMLFDYASRVYYNSHGQQMDITSLYSFLYYSDEWLGHHLIHIGLFGYISMALFAEFLGKEHERLEKEEIICAILLGLGMSIIYYATFEGQAAFMMLILWTSLLIFEIIIIIIKKINIRERPILIATIINSIVTIILFTVWAVLFGLKPYYPYIYQPSELS